MVYTYTSYKQIIKNCLLEKKEHVSKKYTFQNMANHCKVQKTYLSKVLSRDGHLTSDQLYLTADFLGLAADERNYLSMLFELEKTCIPRRREELLVEIEKLRKNVLRTDKYVKSEVLPLSTEELSEFYLDPYLQIVHIFLTIDKYSSDVRLIREKLDLSEERLMICLNTLERLRIIRLQDGKYKVLKKDIYLPPESKIANSCRSVLRLKTLERVDKISRDKAYNFAVIFSTSPEGKEKVHKCFLEFLKKAHKIVAEHEEKEVYQMNFDLFSWSDD